MERSKKITLLAVAVAVVITLVLYGFRDRIVTPGDEPPAARAEAPAAATQAPTQSGSGNPLLDIMSTGEAGTPAAAQVEPRQTWIEELLDILFRLSLAVVLSGILAFRPRPDVKLLKRSLFVSQTQILLSVVAAALMMIVGNNAARAFAIFAAVSLVRFRTNIRDPKEITVLLISLALGLAAGVGRWELGMALCFFALALLWLLEYNESEQVYRSMELRVRTRDTDKARTLLQKIFKRYKIDAEVRKFDPPDEADPVGSLVYFITLPLNLSTDRLSAQIMRADPDNIEGIDWSQKKGSSKIYG